MLDDVDDGRLVRGTHAQNEVRRLVRVVDGGARRHVRHVERVRERLGCAQRRRVCDAEQREDALGQNRADYKKKKQQNGMSEEEC